MGNPKHNGLFFGFGLSKGSLSTCLITFLGECFYYTVGVLLKLLDGMI